MVRVDPFQRRVVVLLAYDRPFSMLRDNPRSCLSRTLPVIIVVIMHHEKEEEKA